jgi:hypothetical protein
MDVHRDPNESSHKWAEKNFALEELRQQDGRYLHRTQSTFNEAEDQSET